MNSLTQIQKNAINELSLSCAKEDGPAVYMARSYRSLIENVIYNYPYDCDSPISGNNKIIHSSNNTQSLNLLNRDGELTLTSGTSELFNLEIFDLAGKVVFSTEISANKSIKLNLVRGVYVYKLFSKTGESYLLRDKILIM